jgi:hypothetical protein
VNAVLNAGVNRGQRVLRGQSRSTSVTDDKWTMLLQ